jgi:hypothetical protein
MTTGYIQPQATENPFRGNAMAPQPTGFSPFAQTNQLQPAPTGVNPFLTQQNGLPFSTNPFPVAGPPPSNPFGALNGSPYASASSPSTHLNPFPSQTTRSVSQPFPFASPNQPTFTDLSNTTAPTPTSAFNATPASSYPARPASTPLIQTKASSPSLKPLKPHQTGSRNPFGVPKAPSPPPLPRAPTLFELATGVPQPSQNPTQLQPQQTGAPTTTFASVASSFLSNSSSPPVPQLTTSFTTAASGPGTTTASTPTSTTTGSTFSDSLFGQPTGSSNTAFSSQPTGSPLRPQATGYSAGIKAFKPTSSFGATLLESLPPIPQESSLTNPEVSASGTGGFGGLGAQPTGFIGTTTTGVGLRPQAVANAGVVNPFRASMLAGGPGPGPGPGAGGAFGANAGASLFLQPTGAPPPSSSFGQNLNFGFQADPAKRQNGAASLI